MGNERFRGRIAIVSHWKYAEMDHTRQANNEGMFDGGCDLEWALGEAKIDEWDKLVGLLVGC